MSLIEILISITLMGTVVVATLTALTTSITASAVDRDHANAHAWLQTAADTLYASDLTQCNAVAPGVVDVDDIKANYRDVVQNTENPEHWPPGNIDVVGIELWHYDIVAGHESSGWGTLCDSSETNLQKVQLRVRAEDGSIVEEVEVVLSAES